jgi:hypothetical protein
VISYRVPVRAQVERTTSAKVLTWLRTGKDAEKAAQRCGIFLSWMQGEKKKETEGGTFNDMLW